MYDKYSDNESWYKPLEREKTEVNEDEERYDFGSISRTRTFSEPYWSEKDIEEKKKKPRRSLTRFMGVLVLVLVVVIGSAIYFAEPDIVPEPNYSNKDSGTFSEDYKDFFSDYYEPIEDTDTAETTVTQADFDESYVFSYGEIMTGEELSLQEIYELCSPYVVSITANSNELSYSWGSGVIISEDGYIVTNTHVIEGSSSIIITLYDDTQYEASLVGADSTSDLSVLKIEASGLVYATFCDPDEVDVGDSVVAIGNPLGEDFRGTMTNGIVSAINRDISIDGQSMTLIQTNAAINEGNSGGPLINMYGQVIGITNVKMMTSSTYNNVEGIGFAIPTDTIKDVVEDLITSGVVTGRPAIGITVGSIPQSASDYYGLPAGLYVTDVSTGSDAELKGLAAGDVITKINGIEVTTTYDVSAILDVSEVGDVLEFEVYRSGETFVLEIELVETSDIYE